MIIGQHLQSKANFVIKTSVPRNAPFRSSIVMSTWSQRLAKAQANVASPVEGEPIGHLSLPELKKMTMDFGKAHVGKTFLEVWQSEPTWIKWFLAHYASSSKVEHRRMIRFIQLMIEEAESETPQPSAKSLPKALGAQPKSLSKPQDVPELPVESEMDAFEMMSEAPWVAAAETREDIHALQARMLSLETAMQRMLMMMQTAMHNQQPMPANQPDTGAAEWDDPWNN